MASIWKNQPNGEPSIAILHSMLVIQLAFRPRVASTLTGDLDSIDELLRVQFCMHARRAHETNVNGGAVISRIKTWMIPVTARQSRGIPNHTNRIASRLYSRVDLYAAIIFLMLEFS